MKQRTFGSSLRSAVLSLATATLFFAYAGRGTAITIDTVAVGAPGNSHDANTGHLYGGVNYVYRLGKTEVTNAQYVAFLNAVAADDPYGLYSPSMGSDTRGGIIRSGLPGSYAYAIKAAAQNGAYAYDNKPVVFVNWASAARFTNWLHNGRSVGVQGPGTTENGAYPLNGATSSAALTAITRNAGALWFLPTEDEWYKSAYYNAAAGSYYSFPTNSNAVPNNNLPSADTGNSANFYNVATGFATDSSVYPLTDAGAYSFSAGPYGTFDQGGNVREWTETAVRTSLRVVRGGAWNHNSFDLQASIRPTDYTTLDGTGFVGFRVAAIPEPGSAGLCLMGLLGMFSRRCRLAARPRRSSMR